MLRSMREGRRRVSATVDRRASLAPHALPIEPGTLPGRLRRIVQTAAEGCPESLQPDPANNMVAIGQLHSILTISSSTARSPTHP